MRSIAETRRGRTRSASRTCAERWGRRRSSQRRGCGRRGAPGGGALPLIGVVGEIFCRLNTFSNENLIQCLEGYGAEAWISDLVEWIWYTTSEHFRKLKLQGRIWTAEALGAWVRKKVQLRDEHVL